MGHPGGPVARGDGRLNIHINYTYYPSGNSQQALDDAAAATQENLDKAWEIWDEQNA